MISPDKPKWILIPVFALAIAGCTTPTKPLETAKQQNQPVAPGAAEDASVANASGAVAGEPEEKQTKIINQKNTVSQKGTFIRVLVNGEPITNHDIQRRAKLRQLRRLSTNQEDTIKELIDDKIKISAARDRNAVAGDRQVEEAFANFALGNKSTPAKMAGDLDGFGVGAGHFKEYIRTQITWSRLAGAKLQQQTQQKSQNQAIFELRKTGQAKPETTDYLLQQITFVIPKGKPATMAKARTAEALAFRQQYQGCAKAVEQAKGLHDVAVTELGRMMQPELPPLWAEKIKAVSEGQLTEPQTTEKGVEMIGICRAKATSDDRAAQVISQANTFETLDKKGDSASDEFLEELRKSAVIIYR